MIACGLCRTGPFVGVLLSLGLVACGRSPERFSQVEIRSPAGKTIYVKRLQRGVSHDQLWLSGNGATCRLPSESDYVFRESGVGAYPMYFQWQHDGSLLLFVGSPSPMPKMGFPVRIVEQQVGPIFWDKLEERRNRGEISSAQVDMSAAESCVFAW